MVTYHFWCTIDFPHYIKKMCGRISNYGMFKRILILVFVVFDLHSHNQTCRAGKSTLIDIALVLSDSIVIGTIIQIHVAHITYIYIVAHSSSLMYYIIFGGAISTMSRQHHWKWWLAFESDRHFFPAIIEFENQLLRSKLHNVLAGYLRCLGFAEWWLAKLCQDLTTMLGRWLHILPCQGWLSDDALRFLESIPDAPCMEYLSPFAPKITQM